jgi:hypothetical protein
MTGASDTTRQLNASAICLSCGLCCNGALSFCGDLTMCEVSTARSCGLDVCDTTTVPVFRLPCPQYRNQRCAVYYEHGRPRTCSGYCCWVLQRYLEGRLTLRSAQKIVELAISFNAAVAARIGLTNATGILGGHFKSGHSWTGQNRPPRAWRPRRCFLPQDLSTTQVGVVTR